MSNTHKSNVVRLMMDVETIATPQGRVVGTQGHINAEKALAGRLKEIGCRPYRGRSFRLPYMAGTKEFTNLIGVIPGENRSLAPILIGAHYDSVIESHCADDNAAAVAICLTAAANLLEYGKLDRDIIIALFDAEEPPYFSTNKMGSRRFVKEQMDKRGVHAAIIMDLVGHDVSFNPSAMGGWVSKVPGIKKLDIDVKIPRFHNMVFITGCESHPELPGVLDTCDQPEALRLLPTLNEYIGDMSDHGIFRTTGVPYLFLSCGRWAHYHQTTDTPDRLNYDKMAHIADLVVSLTINTSATSLPAVTGEVDTTEIESKYMLDALGPVGYQIVANNIGSDKITTRAELSEAVELLAAAL